MPGRLIASWLIGPPRRPGFGALGSDGWEVGVGPSVVVMDEGMARTMTTTTAKDDIYAFIFGQKGDHGRPGYPGVQDHPDATQALKVSVD